MSGDEPETRPDRAGTRWERNTLDAAPGEPAPAIAPGAPPPASAFDPRSPRFELGAELGRGGMGRVVAATDTALDRPVAIKQAHAQRVEDLMRFEREVRITARLEHPAIVPIHDAGRDAQGRPYYVMRRIEGEPLSDRAAAALGARGRLALVPYVLAAVDAAAFAHARGVVHRDIKPWNILVGPYGETLLIDWGLARRLDEPEEPSTGPEPSGSDAPALTRAGFAMGTPGYMAPEQARGEQVDARADVYALGATLLHVLCGTTPFDGPYPSVWIEHAARGEPPPIHRIGERDAVPAELIAIVLKAMAGSPADRYADASELAADLRAFLAGQLVHAHAYTARERLARFVRKHRVAVSVGGAALIALATVGVLAVQRVVREREVADAARIDAEAGQRLAAERAEQMLLDRASMLASTDPTRAVALLRRFPVGSRNIRRARDIVSVASGSGIAHAAATHVGQVNALDVSPDGRWLLSAGEDGVIQLHEVATGATRKLAPSVGPVTHAVWLDGGATIVHNAYPRGLYAVDVASGARRELAGDVVTGALWVTRPDRVRYVDSDARTLVERSSARDGAPAIIARDVGNAIGEGELAVVEGSGVVRLVARGTERVLATYGARDPGDIRLALSPALGRVAAASGGAIAEWTLDGAPRGRWKLPRVMLLVYSHAALYAAAIVGRTAVFYLGQQPEEELASPSSAMWIAATGRGVALAGDDGTIWVLGPAGIHRLPYDLPGSRVLGSRPGSTVLAMGARDGTVRWWDLAHVVPQTQVLPRGTLCAYDASTIYVHGDNAVTAVDRATGAVRRVVEAVTSNRPRSFTLSCRDTLASGALVFGDQTSPASVVVDPHNGRSLELPGVPYVTVDQDADALVYEHGREVIEIAHGVAPPRVRWTAPRDVDVVASAGRWIGAALVDGTLARIDRTTGAVALAKSPAVVALFGMTPDGTVWFSLGHALWRWDTVRPPAQVAELPGDVIHGSLLDDATFAIELADHSVWQATGTRIISRASAAQRTVFLGVRGIGVTVEGSGRAVVRYLGSGESLTHQLSMPIRTIVTGTVDRSIAVQVSNIAAFYGDPVPEDPAQLDAWIARATNAVIEPESDALSWH